MTATFSRYSCERSLSSFGHIPLTSLHNIPLLDEMKVYQTCNSSRTWFQPVSQLPRGYSGFVAGTVKPPLDCG